MASAREKTDRNGPMKSHAKEGRTGFTNNGVPIERNEEKSLPRNEESLHE